MTTERTIYTMDTIKDFCAARDAGEMAEVDEELFDYFLEVLPPVHMLYTAHIGADNHIQRASFGFAEGYERVTAFWRKDGRFFAQLTNEWNRY